MKYECMRLLNPEGMPVHILNPEGMSVHSQGR
jgi:hypothetical protein